MVFRHAKIQVVALIANLIGKENYNVLFHDQFLMIFSCQFDLGNYPFDTQECDFKYGDNSHGIDYMTLNATKVIYGNASTTLGIDPIIIYHSEFEIEVTALTPFQITLEFANYSQAGIHLKMRRKSVGKLLSGYYYPTASFALVSMISFLIDPDVVSFSNHW